MNKNKVIFSLLLLLLAAVPAFSQTCTFGGVVFCKSNNEPVEFATVVLEGSGQWAVADEKGAFSIPKVQTGKNTVSISCLGYETVTMEITISKDITNFRAYLKEDNLALESAVVTAKTNSSVATTSRTIDKTALDHVQLMNVSDISSLLPGGMTSKSNPSLTSSQNFNLRADSGEAGNATFGTAVEVDGVRLSSNASMAGASITQGTNLKGAATNSIASSNIESVEVITGVPSVEYGDMTSGVVKINTRKGKTPWTVTMSTNPYTKQASLSKGFGLGSTKAGASRGVLNASAEYTYSISEPMSPYTSYSRRQLSLTYSNLFAGGALASTPIRFSASVTGNLGGLNTSADPDAVKDTWSKNRDNAVRGNVSFDWLLSKSWITNVEFNASISYGDRLSRVRNSYMSTMSSASLHATQGGYYMSGDNSDATMIPAGTWYNTMVDDDKPLAAKVGLKANWARNFGKVNSKLKIGGEWTADKNLGVGAYSEDEATAPTYRPYRYCDLPLMSNVAVYAEENLMIPVSKDGRINIIAGLRNDNTIIPGSAYGVTSSVSPRFNFKYTAFTPKTRRENVLKELSLRASWGMAVKQPSYAILYPAPSYQDIEVFTSTVDAANVIHRAYYVLPRTIEYNPALRWQKGQQAEIGMEMKLGGASISLAGFLNRTLDSYSLVAGYDRFTHLQTLNSSVQGSAIPAEDRIYSVNPQNGAITVSDRNGVIDSFVADNIEYNRFTTRTTADNCDNPVTRYGVEWVVDFPKIRPIGTTIRLDGTYYGYKSLLTDTRAYCPYTTNGSDGKPYRYVAFFYGDNSNTNGTRTRTLKTNLTITTHIPKVRLILSAKFECTLLKTTDYLSERLDGKSRRSYVLTDRSNLLSYDENASVYDKNGYAVLYPDYYTSFDDPTPKDFLEQFRWAKENDAALYSDLSKLVVTTSYDYIFKKESLTPYFSANFSVTKEIGDIASLSFYANNFFNNMSQVKSRRTGDKTPAASLISRFYYGLTLRLKF